MVRSYTRRLAPVLLTLLILLSFLLWEAPRALAWDTTVYARNCNPDSGSKYKLFAFNGGDLWCAFRATTNSAGFLETAAFLCNETGKEGCQLSLKMEDGNCNLATSVSSGGTLLVYGNAGYTLETATATSSSANCCAMSPGISNGDCESFFEECREKGIGGLSCMASYVPCRQGGGDADACSGGQ